MLDDCSRPLPDSPADDPRPGNPPDLTPMRPVAERGELTDAMACLADSHGPRLRDDHPLAPLARDLAEALTLAGFTMHHCARTDPQHSSGGVCFSPATAGSSYAGHDGVMVSWTPHALLTSDRVVRDQNRRVQDIVNRRLREILRALGFAVQPSGHGGVSLVTGRRSERQGAAR